MLDKEFMEKAVDLVIEYYNNLTEMTGNFKLSEKDVCILWMTNILGNNKAYLSTKGSCNIYEITYDEKADKFYFEAYMNVSHQVYDNSDKGLL